MSVPYDVFTSAFLDKISEYDLLELYEEDRNKIVCGYMKRAISAFKKNCRYDLTNAYDDNAMAFNIDIDDNDIDEIVDIVSEGMLVQWLKPYVYKQELLENTLNTRDFTQYSPAELLNRVRETHKQAKHNYTQLIREYSYNHADLTELHI